MSLELSALAGIPSPALIIDLNAVSENIRRMISIAESPARLRPHVKTHKLAELVRLQLPAGISRFKCATIAEAEMVAAAGGGDILIAMAPVGPNARRMVELIRLFPEVNWRTIGDDPGALLDLASIASDAACEVDVLVDLNVGQNRSGIRPGPAVADLVRLMITTPGLRFGGLHAYDGHIHQTGISERNAACASAWDEVNAVLAGLESEGLPSPPRIVAGGTPSFPFHAKNPNVECSPGTCILWDAGYAAKFPDLQFVQAAWLLTRVISRPASDRICLDLGHKAVASEMPHPRVVFPEIPNARPVMHNEEHLVIEGVDATALPPGTPVLGIPWHVCPTVALHAECVALKDGHIAGIWPVTSRARKLTV